MVLVLLLVVLAVALEVLGIDEVLPLMIQDCERFLLIVGFAQVLADEVDLVVDLH